MARVEPRTVGQATYDDLFAAEAGRVAAPNAAAPVPPHFETCIRGLEVVAKKLNIKLRSHAPLLEKCRSRYEELRERTLDRLIEADWVIGGATELGLTVTPAQVEQELERSKQKRFPTEAGFKRYLARTARTSR